MGVRARDLKEAYSDEIENQTKKGREVMMLEEIRASTEWGGKDAIKMPLKVSKELE